MKNQIKYPMDNSFAVCISNPKKEARLAGVYNTLAKPVEIVSEPFDMKIKSLFSDTYETYNFVMVKYEEDTYIVLNHFHHDYESMFRQKQMMKMIW